MLPKREFRLQTVPQAPEPSAVDEVFTFNCAFLVGQVVYRRFLKDRSGVVCRSNYFLHLQCFHLRRRQARELRERVVKQNTIRLFVSPFCRRRVTVLCANVRVGPIEARFFFRVSGRRVDFFNDSVSNKIVFCLLVFSTSGIAARDRVTQLRLRPSTYYFRQPATFMRLQWVVTRGERVHRFAAQVGSKDGYGRPPNASRDNRLVRVEYAKMLRRYFISR